MHLKKLVHGCRRGIALGSFAPGIHHGAAHMLLACTHAHPSPQCKHKALASRQLIALTAGVMLPMSIHACVDSCWTTVNIDVAHGNA